MSLSLTGLFLLHRTSLDHEILFLPHQVISSIFLQKLRFNELFHTVHPLWCQGLLKFFSQIKKKNKKIKPLICVGTNPRVPVCFPFILAGRSHLVSENVRNWAEYPAQQTGIDRTDIDGKVGQICLHLGNGQITWTKGLFYFMKNI